MSCKASVPGHKFCKKFGAATIRLGDSANSLGGCSCEVENHVVFWALWELPWNRLQKPLACPAKSLKTLGGVLNPVSFSRQFPKSQKNLAQIRKTTGLSISAMLKQGLLAYQEKITHTTAATPYEIYQALDLGPGGYTLAPSTETRQGVRTAL